jgi:hypothetical protein
MGVKLFKSKDALFLSEMLGNIHIQGKGCTHTFSFLTNTHFTDESVVMRQVHFKMCVLLAPNQFQKAMVYSD